MPPPISDIAGAIEDDVYIVASYADRVVVAYSTTDYDRERVESEIVDLLDDAGVDVAIEVEEKGALNPLNTKYVVTVPDGG